ncbi:hypothetical protein GQ457_13G023430 [Hibiscus cannabinus]
MASLAQHFTGLRCSPLSSSRFSVKPKQTQKVGAFASPKPKTDLNSRRCSRTPTNAVGLFLWKAFLSLLTISKMLLKNMTLIPNLEPRLRERSWFEENEADDSLILSLRSIQYEQDAGNFKPRMLSLVFSDRKAMADSQAQLGIGSVVLGIVQTLKPYGAFIDIGGINGLLHVSQISHDRVSDIATVLQPGDTLKRPSKSFYKETRTYPWNMIRNPTLVFEKAEEMAQTFRQRIAQAKAMARADMLRFQPESGLTLSSDGILGPLTADLSAEGLDLSDVPTAAEVS